MIVALTPNLAIDRTTQLDRPLRPHEMHRALTTSEHAGGKGVNLARTVCALGGECVVAGFVAGHNGVKLRQLLERDRIDGVFREVEGETRECHILLDPVDGSPTEINELGPVVTRADWEALVADLPPGVIVLAGSLPPLERGLDASTIVQSLARTTVVDTSGAALVAAVERGVRLVKPNRPEFDRLFEALAGECSRHEQPEENLAAYVACAREVHRRSGTSVLLSLGSEGALLVEDRAWFARAPSVRSVNPVGSGDAMLGAYLWALEHGESPDTALRIGVAAGADNARRGGGGSATLEGVEELAEHISVEDLG